MRLFLYVCLERFFVGQPLLADDDGRALIVHHAKRVLDSDLTARAKHVFPGMGLPEAKAILGSDGRYVPYVESDFLPARDAWLDHCLTYADRIEPESPASAWVDLGDHPDPADIASRLVLSLGRDGRFGLAPAKWVAKLAASPVEFQGLPVGFPLVEPVLDVARFLEPLATERLSPIALEHRERLVTLGYRRVGDVARAPVEAFVGQFGKEGLLIHHCAKGLHRDRFRATYPPAALAMRRRFAPALEDEMELLTALDGLATSLAGKLIQGGKMAQSIELTVLPEDEAPLKAEHGMAKPTQRAAPIVQALRQMWPQVRPQVAVEALRVTLPKLRPAEAKQLNLMPGKDAQVRDGALNTALAGLRTTFGEGIVAKAGELALPRRKEVLRAWSQATGWR